MLLMLGVLHGWFRSAALVMALSATGAPLAIAQSKPADWLERPYDYVVVDQDIRTVIEEFGRNTGVRTSISTAVQGRVRGSLPRGSARAFLDIMTRSHGLDWYFDGAALFVSTMAEERTRLLDLHGKSVSEAIESLKTLDLYDGRFQLRPGPSSTTATVSGPPRFVESVSDIVASQPINTGRPSKSFVVTVFQGAGPGERTVFQVDAGK